MILLNDLKKQYLEMKKEIDEAIQKVIDRTQFIGGEELESFEKNFASYCEEEYCIGASSGSTALYTALKCLGVKEGDEVIVPVNTFIATAFAVTLCGAKPVFVDVNEDDFLINTELVEEKITNKTKGIIPVHLHGNVCDMEKIKEISERHNLFIVEDCAQAHGSEYKGEKVPVSDIGCFSFFPAKNLGAFGDAGCIVVSNKDFAEKCRKFVNHGRVDKYEHVMEGFNFRLDNLQAAVLDVKLKHLEKWTQKRRELAKKYDSGLVGIRKQKISDNVKSSYHLYVIRSKKRGDLQKSLKERGIQTGVHYPIPLHLQPAFSYLGYKEGDFPVAEKLSKEMLSIPLYPELDVKDQEKIINSISRV